MKRGRKPKIFNDDDFADPYDSISYIDKKCESVDHTKKLGNCIDNLYCIYGLGEYKDGIWKEKPNCLLDLGENPFYRLRQLDPKALTYGSQKSLTVGNYEQCFQSCLNNKLDLTPVGLRNLGATCYLNVLMQSLFHNLLIRDAVFNINISGASDLSIDQESSRLSMESITNSLQNAFAFMQSSRRSTYDLEDFTSEYMMAD
jgi:hypothetical protein